MIDSPHLQLKCALSEIKRCEDSEQSKRTALKSHLVLVFLSLTQGQQRPGKMQYRRDRFVSGHGSSTCKSRVGLALTF
ncbi:hypothetical protein Q5P01_021931 [Channa striata]|uniref:Uncharacterized protein n=1 Tax=Channa striata TaxID=64152 RepID=A0AA88LV48_CHASR|nr:hypothetical protein Q5P01_021931 [Channa striata]